MLPVRNGVGPSRVVLPPGPWATLLDFLVQRFPQQSAAQWRACVDAGEVVDAGGRAISATQPYAPHGKLFYYRHVHGETVDGEPVPVLFQDEQLVVADKPHFMPVTPSGPYLQQTLLVRLRRQLDLPTLTPLHRIDRETAGLVLFATRHDLCGPYKALFAGRQVSKQYEAIAPAQPVGAPVQFPLTRHTHMADAEHFMQMREVPAGSAAAREATLTTPPAARRRRRRGTAARTRHAARRGGALFRVRGAEGPAAARGRRVRDGRRALVLLA